MVCFFFSFFRKSFSDVFQTFALIKKEVANQTIEICKKPYTAFPKETKKNVLGSSF